MAAPVILMIAVGSNEFSVLRTTYVSMPAVLALGAGCVMGLAMNFFSWRLRELVSATTVTVIGAALRRPDDVQALGYSAHRSWSTPRVSPSSVWPPVPTLFRA
jgi:hypothetical protein